jgi:hypothetical protein
MNKLYVYADFDWLPSPELIGELNYESLRGSDSYGFKFNNAWLSNHGFLLTSRGWTLSPAYDINPTLNDHQCLMITANTNRADLGLLLEACEEYMLPRATAERIINEVKTAMATWRSNATKLGIAKREIDYFTSKLDSTK